MHSASELDRGRSVETRARTRGRPDSTAAAAAQANARTSGSMSLDRVHDAKQIYEAPRIAGRMGRAGRDKRKREIGNLQSRAES